MINTKSLFLWVISLPLCGFSYAAFDVKKYQTPPIQYGQGQNQTFTKAIVGGTPITTDEQKDISRLLPASDRDRYFGRASISFGNVGVTHVSNQSKGIYAGGPIQKKRYASQSGLEFAFGYSWTNWRGEAEALINRNFSYNASFLGSSVNQSLQSTVNNTTLFINAFYDFEGIGFLKPFLMGGIGVGSNSTQNILYQNGNKVGSQPYRDLGLAANIGLGLRYRLLNNWDLQLAYRYGILGPCRWRVDPNFKALGLSRLNALSFGLVYFF